MFGNFFKVKREKMSVFTLVFMLVFGIVFAGAGWLGINSSRIDKSWTRVSGDIVGVTSSVSDGSTVYLPTVRYVVIGQEYQVTSSSGSSFYPKVGEKKEIAYNPAQPAQAKVVEGTGSTLILWLFPIIGIAIFVFGVVSFIFSAKRSKKINSLLSSGIKTQGVLVDIQSTLNNRGSYKIVVSATDNSGVVQSYVSDALNGVSGLSMVDFRSNPVPIDVYIDPSNPKNYYVDISDIPNLTPDRIKDLITNAKTTYGSSNNVVTDQPKPPTPPNNLT